MRKWKIRTKMIAVLSGLAVVIGVLIYSSWSQLTRDQNLASEISQLADEVRYAHKLNHWVERLRSSYQKHQRIKTADPLLIESDRMLELGEGGHREIYDEEYSRSISAIDDNFSRLDEILNGYENVLSQRNGKQDSVELLTDREKQEKGLQEVSKLLEHAKGHWEKSTEVSALASRRFLFNFHNPELERLLDELSAVATEHSATDHERMKEFGESVYLSQQTKRSNFWFCTLLSVFLIGFLVWQFWTLIAVPFQTLVRGSQLIASGHFQHKILLGTNDEIGLMADTVNDITARFNQAVARATIARQNAEREVQIRTRQVIQNEQLASVGFLAAGVAHEINNPLGAIAWGSEALEQTLDEMPERELSKIDPEFVAEIRTNLGLIQSEAYRCKGITERLLNFSRLSDSTRSPFDIGDLVERVVSMVAKVGEYRCKTIVTDIDPSVTAYANQQEVQQVILNLVSNALESVDTDGKVDVRVRCEPDPMSGVQFAVVEVQDNGCGMDPEVMEHLFEPFFTRRRDKTGTGLGLSISYRIVSLHHGSLTPYSEGEGRGSKMVLRLPVEPPGDQSPAAEETERKRVTEYTDVQKVA